MMAPQICVSIVEREIEDILRNSKKALKLGADLLELRLDYLSELEEEKVKYVTREVKKLGLPVILTIRKEGYGGNFPQKRKGEQIKLLLSGVERADFVDIELETHQGRLEKFIAEVKERGKKVMVSSHNLKETPSLEEILNILDKEKKVGADVCKFVGKANKMGDNLPPLLANLKFEGKKILFCSGKLGRSSRILAPLFGSEWTFASLKKGKEAMSGQLGVRTTRKLINDLKND